MSEVSRPCFPHPPSLKWTDFYNRVEDNADTGYSHLWPRAWILDSHKYEATLMDSCQERRLGEEGHPSLLKTLGGSIFVLALILFQYRVIEIQIAS